MNRSAGILLPVFSLPSPYGIGCFDGEAYRFVDFLAEAGQSYWQILPLGPTGYGDSPYQAFSTFAGSPLYISLEAFIEKGLLKREECNQADLQASPHLVDYERQYRHRYPLLRRVFERSRESMASELEDFQNAHPHLADYALFAAIKASHKGTPWYEWENSLRHRDANALDETRQQLYDEIAYQVFLQYHFYQQWQALKTYANSKGIRIIGDIPIYAAYDSADVWSNPELFQMDENKRPSAVAGCPPDGFSSDGQLWGNPLYAWQYHAQTHFAWWCERLKYCFSLYDVVRIDHFRGFDEYFSIPYGAPDARGGHWEKGPGMALFSEIENTLGRRKIIAEDLGFMTESVRRLVKDTGFPNMKVLEFAFDARDTGGSGEHLPHNYGENCIAYTGTHDNQTLAAWLTTITDAEREQVRGYLNDWYTPQHLLPQSLISLLMKSPAKLCMIPLQDYLGLDDEARINTPSTSKGNWRWRVSAGSTNNTLAKKIKGLTELYGRAPQH